jgi:hypothetical protein
MGIKLNQMHCAGEDEKFCAPIHVAWTPGVRLRQQNGPQTQVERKVDQKFHVITIPIR